MYKRILLTSPDRKTTKLLERIRKDLNFRVDVYEVTFEDAVEFMRNELPFKERRNHIIATGGATLKLLRDDLGRMSWVNIFPTEYDLFIALKKAKQTKKTIGLFIPGQVDLNTIKTICTDIQIEVFPYIYNSWEEILTQVEKASSDGVEVVVGAGDKISSAVSQKNIQYISVTSGEFTFRRAFQYAQLLIDSKHSEMMTNECIKAISESSREGIIYLNERDIFVNANSKAANFFGLHEKDLIGQSLHELSGYQSLISLFKDYEHKVNYIHHTPNGTILVNKVPIFSNNLFKGIVINFREVGQAEAKNRKKDGLAKGFVARHHFKDIINHNSKMTEVISMAMKYANTDCNILIRGETGTGKELISQSIHNSHSKRSKKPFVAVNCASLDGNLLNSELFGYSEGAFTGALKGGKPGLFEIAHGGTLFLDEIDKMKLDVQGKLLRVIQEKEVRRIGSDQVIPVDVRIIAASNEDLYSLVRKGEFREDLYYRLNVLKLNLPPLRERRGDIPYLVKAYLKKYTKEYNKKNPELPLELLNKLSNCDWPGNIRQLDHFIERCVVLCDDGNDLPQVIQMMLEEEFARPYLGQEHKGLGGEGNFITVEIRSLEEMNAEIAQKVKAKKNITNGELASMLGISRPTLLKLLKNGT